MTSNKKLSFLFAMLLLIACSTEKEATYDLVITNVNLIDGTGARLQEGVNLYIKDGIIVAIDSVDLTKRENLIDGKGQYLIPGLFDCHVHTTDYQRDFPRFIHFGVTSVFITGGSKCTNAYYKAMREMGAQDTLPAPNVFHTSQHFSMEGRHPAKTYKSSNWKNGETIFFLKDTNQIEQLVEQVAQQPILGIKLTIEDGPDPPFVERIPQTFINKVNREASKRGFPVFAHVSDNEELKMALKGGITNIVHFTGVDLDFIKDKELVDQIYQNKLNWVTTLMIDKSFLYPNYPEWLEEEAIQGIYSEEELAPAKAFGLKRRTQMYVSFMEDYLQLDSLTLKDVVQFQVDDITVLLENDVNMVLGTDTGNDLILPGYSLHEEMQLLELGGIAPINIIKMGTLNAAKMMKVDHKLGSIEVGKQADMVLLEKNPMEKIANTLAINSVIKNGRLQSRTRN